MLPSSVLRHMLVMILNMMDMRENLFLVNFLLILGQYLYSFLIRSYTSCKFFMDMRNWSSILPIENQVYFHTKFNCKNSFWYNVSMVV